MVKEKACKKCRTIYIGSKCPKCGSDEFSDTFKGKIKMIDPENSEIGNKLKFSEKGEFAIKL